jgi:hypothetical protein
MDETMDNQQVTQTDLAWLAGIWDGEGHFSIRRTMLSSKTPQYSPRLGITYFREKGEGGFDGSSKQCWVIAIETMSNAVRAIVAVRPYLVGKCFQADCVLEYCERRLKVADRKRHNNDARKYTERDFKLIEMVFEANGDIRGTSETIRQDAHRAMI